MNTMSKMSRSNCKSRNWMLKNGFQDIQFFPHARWSKDVHIGPVGFDGIASRGTCLALFQVKSNKRIPKKEATKYAELSAKYRIITLWFNAIDRKPLEVFIVENGEIK